MIFDSVTIVGLGLIGGSLAAAFKQKQVVGRLIGVDFPPIHSSAVSRRLISQGFGPDQLTRAVQRADVVILATPIKETLELLPGVAHAVKPGALITDVCSTKAAVVHCAQKCCSEDVYFLGGHPMAGSERQGLEYADPLMFENAVYVLTNSGEVPDSVLQRFVALIEAIGAKIIFLSPALHDKMAAVVSHLPQMLAVSLMNLAAQQNEKDDLYLKLAAGGFRDMTRVASSPYEMWADICATNAGNIKWAIDQFVAELERTKQAISDGQLESKFRSAAHNRLSIPTDSRGFLKPHYDISVVVEDRPGMIAGIAQTLASADINIKDIEVLKVREGDAGTLRLALESERDRERAVQRLTESGFQTSIRA
ncbi:MAG: prephenate dehydrogenase/arogenate dehydrogenase family protein [bacterium]